MKDNDDINSEQKQVDGKSPPVPFADNLPKAKVSNGKGDHQKRQSIKGFKDRFTFGEKWSQIISTLLFIVTALQLYVMSGQLKEMQDSGHQADTLISHVGEQVEVARRLLDETRREFLFSQRPYITINSGFPTEFVPDREIFIDIGSVNHGKSPAIKAGGSGAIFIGKDAQEKAYEWFDKVASKAVLNHPETIIPSGVPTVTSTVRTFRPISASEIANFMRNDWTIFIVYRQEYFDIAGNRYWTDLCRSRFVTGAIVHCPKHNDMH